MFVRPKDVSLIDPQIVISVATASDGYDITLKSSSSRFVFVGGY